MELTCRVCVLCLSQQGYINRQSYTTMSDAASVVLFVLSVISLAVLLVAILVLMLPGMKQRAKKLQEQRGFHALVYLALVCGHVYIALMLAAAGFASFCTQSCSVLLILLLEFMVAPTSAQVLFLWLKLKKKKPLVAERHHRKLWTKAASRVAYLQIVVTVGCLLSFLLVHSGDGTNASAAANAPAAAAATSATPGCVGSGMWDFAAFSDAFSVSGVERRTERSLLQALWLLTLVPLLLSYVGLCRVGHSSFIPLFGDDWKKLQQLSSAVAVAFLWQLLCLFVDDPTYRLVALYVEVCGRASYALSLPSPHHPQVLTLACHCRMDCPRAGRRPHALPRPLAPLARHQEDHQQAPPELVDLRTQPSLGDRSPGFR